eukprot:2701221-Karenia_brevis.AAC.1
MHCRLQEGVRHSRTRLAVEESGEAGCGHTIRSVIGNIIREPSRACDREVLEQTISNWEGYQAGRPHVTCFVQCSARRCNPAGATKMAAERLGNQNGRWTREPVDKSPIRG